MALPFLFGATVSADRFTSPNYTIDASGVGNSLSGPQSSTNYSLTSSGGESVIGNGAGGSYKISQGYVAQLEQALQLTVQPGGLGLYAPMDEGAGTAVHDNSINTAVGSFVNSPSWTTGKIGGALTISTVNAVEFPKSAAVTPTSAITLEAWIKPTNVNATGSQKIISSTQSGGITLFLTGTAADICATTKVCFAIRIGAGYQIVEAAKTYVPDDTWTHLVGTYNGSVMKLYINGIERGSTTTSGSISYNATAPLCIGIEPDATSCASGSYFTGIIDEVKLFSRGLTAKEALAEYTAQDAGLAAGLSLNNLTPGVSQTATFDAAVQTDAPGYSLSINQNQNLTSGGNTISAISGSIGTPVTWTEGTTKGLGFTLYGTNATAIPGKWSSGGAYAALPNSATSFYTRTGFTAGSKDVLNMRLRLDTPTSQATGDYSNQMTLTGTMTP